MQLKNGRWVCEQCGAVVDMPIDDPWHTEIVGRSGDPNVRIVVAAGHEVHRCAVNGLARAQ